MRFIIALLAAFLWAGSAYAGANIVQKDTGATVWEDADGDQWPAGDSGLQVYVADIATEATDFVVSGKAGIITKVYIVPLGAFTAGSAESVFDLGIDPDGDGSFTLFDTAALEVVTVATGTAGVSSSLVPTNTYNVNVGDVISVHGDGSATGTTEGMVTIIIE